jgi:hypothetical protein
MSESTNKSVGHRRTVADAPGIRRNLADILEAGIWARRTSPGSTVNLCSSDPGENHVCTTC